LSSLNPIGTPFIELPTVESTNNYAMGLVHEGVAQHGLAVFTAEQTKGKGQRGREWVSEPGSNMALTVIVKPPRLDGSSLFLFSMAVANACLELIEKYAGEEVSIKWPNDIYWRDRKAAGILIENVWQGNHWKFALVGIGLNVNQTDFGPLGTRAVSLKQITGKNFDAAGLAAELCGLLEQQLHRLNNDPAGVREKYHHSLYCLGKMIRLKKDNRIFEAELIDVSADGRLMVRHAIEESFGVGEAEWQWA
jgi:BirA family biotin operon repressor/biotin-[acetyl-CoA-carboxylase] ligase